MFGNTSRRADTQYSQHHLAEHFWGIIVATPRKRTSFWVRTFAHARADGGWIRVPRLYTKTTAQQIASDISNAHRRELRTFRMRGIAPGERWEARWEWHADGMPGDFSVWIRLGDSD